MTTRLLTRWAAIAVTCTSLVVPFTAKADAPGVGLTAAFEIEFLQMSIDHHYAALRITELAAGTDAQRNGEISPSEGTSPTPGFAVTPAKATLDQLAAAMKHERLAKASFTIEGHADPRGNAARNQQLSLDRAQSVADYLAQTRGLDAARLKAEGKGSSELLKPSEPAAPENRRVTIVARPG